MADRLDRAPNLVGEWFSLVREARGLPGDTVEFRLPKGAQDDWPFDQKLLPLDVLFADSSYQRPVNWPFVRKESARFDPTLVGAIDVAQRSPSSYAILDGQQRMQMVRMVGKGTVWASVYVGLDLPSEARFFLHKNRDRKSVHPYYTYVARLTARDPDAIDPDDPAELEAVAGRLEAALERIVRQLNTPRPQGAAARPPAEVTDRLDRLIARLREAVGTPSGEPSDGPARD